MVPSTLDRLKMLHLDFEFLINDKQGGVCSHTLLCDYHELIKDLLHFFFQPVHTPVNRLFGNLQIPGYFMRAVPLDLHQNDLKGKPVHGDGSRYRKKAYPFSRQISTNKKPQRLLNLCGIEKNKNYVVELKLLH